MQEQNSEQHGLTPANRELEAALGALAPANCAINRDGLMFDLGQASGKRQLRVWQGISGLALSVLATLVIFPLLGPPANTGPGTNNMVEKKDTPKTTAQDELKRTPANQSQTHQAVVQSNTDSPQTALPTLNRREGTYLVMRQIAFTQGVDALPTPQPSANRSDPDTSNTRWRNAPGTTQDHLNQRF